MAFDRSAGATILIDDVFKVTTPALTYLKVKRGIWSSLPPTKVGVDALGAGLSVLPLWHIQQELPAIRNSIQEAVSANEQKLNGLGSARETPE